MTCTELREHALAADAASELDADGRRDLQQHVLSCRACADELTSYRATRAIASRAYDEPDPVLPERFVQRALERFDAENDRSRPQPLMVAPPPVQSSRQTRPRNLAFVMAAAAAMVLALLVSRHDSAPTWQVISVEGPSADHILVDGARVDSRAALALAIEGGRRIDVPSDTRLRLACDDQVALQLQPGTSFVLPEMPGRWSRRTARAELTAGVALISTGEGFHGTRLDVETAEGSVQITGTTLAVIRDDLGTCVCTHEGRVEVRSTLDEIVPVTAGLRRYAFRNGHAGDLEPMSDAETSLLAGFGQAAQTFLAD